MEPITREEQFMTAAAQGKTDLTPITRQECFLSKIAEAVGGGGSGGAGGNGDFVVVKISGSDGANLVSSMSASEIKSAIENGKHIVFYMSDGSGSFIKGFWGEEGHHMFDMFIFLAEGLVRMEFVIKEDKTVSVSQNVYSLTPAT